MGRYSSAASLFVVVRPIGIDLAEAYVVNIYVLSTISITRSYLIGTKGVQKVGH